MNFFERLFRVFYVREIVEEKMRSAQLHGLHAFVQTVRQLRLTTAALIGLIFAIFVAAMGAVALLTGLFLLLPLSDDQRLWVLTVGGAVCFLGPSVLVVLALRESVWLQRSGIQKLLREAHVVPPSSQPQPESTLAALVAPTLSQNPSPRTSNSVEA